MTVDELRLFADSVEVKRRLPGKEVAIEVNEVEE